MKFYFVARERERMTRGRGCLVKVKWNCYVVGLPVKDSVE